MLLFTQKLISIVILIIIITVCITFLVCWFDIWFFYRMIFRLYMFSGGSSCCCCRFFLSWFLLNRKFWILNWLWLISSWRILIHFSIIINWNICWNLGYTSILWISLGGKMTFILWICLILWLLYFPRTGYCMDIKFLNCYIFFTFSTYFGFRTTFFFMFLYSIWRNLDTTKLTFSWPFNAKLILMAFY